MTSSLIPRFFLSSLLAGISFLSHTSHASILLMDDFDNNNPLTGASVHPNTWFHAGGLISESSGKITVTSTGGQWAQAVLNTQVSPAFNIFSNPIKISVRDFELFGTGTNTTSGQNFRIGLMPRYASGGDQSYSFYNTGDDGVNLRITNGNQFQVAYKANMASTDPNTLGTATLGASAGTVPFVITDFDVTFSDKTWEVLLMGANGESSLNRGTWNLTSYQDTWGNATDGWGNAALTMYAQNGNEGEGTVTFSMGSILVTPEPSKALLLVVSALAPLMTRRRAVA